MFSCDHITAAFYDWTVNGSIIGPDPPPDITPGTNRDNDGDLVNTLTILARPGYNGIEVQCEALFRDGSPPELSAIAVLKSTYTM